MRRRVVVTGMAGLSPIGSDWKHVSEAIRSNHSGVEQVAELALIDGMTTRLAARIHDFEVPDDYSRKRTRSMGRVSLLATRATELALADAGLQGSPLLGTGRVGISYGSTSGSPPAIAVYADAIGNRQTLRGIRATDYVQFMSHTVPANLAQFFGIRGRVVTTCSACTSGSQGIGYGFEAIEAGKQDVMITGGAEEFHPIDVAVFDVLFATSTRNDAPRTTPRPFDRARDGLVVGEARAVLKTESITELPTRSGEDPRKRERKKTKTAELSASELAAYSLPTTFARTSVAPTALAMRARRLHAASSKLPACPTVAGGSRRCP